VHPRPALPAADTTGLTIARYLGSRKALPGLPISVVVVVVGATVLVVGASVLVVGTSVLVVGTAVLVVGTAVLVVGTPVVGGTPVVLELVVDGAVVVLPPHTNPPPGDPSQASQQLVVDPTHETPSFASHSAALDSISQLAVAAAPLTVQHVTASGRPQTERAAHPTTSL
jgi:hypothetical protein